MALDLEVFKIDLLMAKGVVSV